MPDLVPYAVPHTALIEAVRGTALTGADISTYSDRLVIGAGWLAAPVIVAPLVYRFTED